MGRFDLGSCGEWQRKEHYRENSMYRSNHKQAPVAQLEIASLNDVIYYVK